VKSWADQHGELFARALAEVPVEASVLVLCHNDADGLSAGALLARGLADAGRQPLVYIVGRGESAWSETVKATARAREPGLLIVADLGVRLDLIAPNASTILIDHHVPQGSPEGATVISGFGEDPTPSSSLLANWSLRGVAEVSELLWLAALGLVGDYGERAPFPELTQARGATV
jgi:single-stranded-DNA-specific exonuclease